MYSFIKGIDILKIIADFIRVSLNVIFYVIRVVRSSQFHFRRVVPRVETNTFYNINIGLR